LEDPASTKRGISEYPTFVHHFFDWGNQFSQLHLHLAKICNSLAILAKLFVIICKLTTKLKRDYEEKFIRTEKEENPVN